MAHTNHMRYGKNVLGKDDPQLSIFSNDLVIYILL